MVNSTDNDIYPLKDNGPEISQEQFQAIIVDKVTIGPMRVSRLPILKGTAVLSFFDPADKAWRHYALQEDAIQLIMQFYAMNPAPEMVIPDVIPS